MTAPDDGEDLLADVFPGTLDAPLPLLFGSRSASGSVWLIPADKHDLFCRCADPTVHTRRL